MSSVIPSAQGAILAVLARTTEPLSGRRVAALTGGRVGPGRTNEVLGALAAAGIVLRDDRPPAKLYRLNRDHVAAAGIIALAQQWPTLVHRIREELAGWQVPAVAACLYGSAARGEAGPNSDLDLLLVPPDEEPPPEWEGQLDVLVDHVRAWSGNACEVLELTERQLAEAAGRDDRLVHDLRRDSIRLTGADVRTLLRRSVAG